MPASTRTPFEVVGAPWMNGRALAARLNDAVPGVRCVPIRFTPDTSKYDGEACLGINMAVTDRAAFDPLVLGTHLACALRALHPNEWETDKLDRLLCDAAVRDAILAGRAAADVIALWRDELAAFEKRRAKYLIYR